MNVTAIMHQRSQLKQRLDVMYNRYGQFIATISNLLFVNVHLMLFSCVMHNH